MPTPINSQAPIPSFTLAIDPEVLARLRDAASARGLSAESLANLWLQERVLKQDG
ncbi:MAG TPA: hypothetical protein VJ754_06650 [Anaerolineae bacterium]|nr:hypothetical protein [Anaerolineae bacterium]